MEPFIKHKASQLETPPIEWLGGELEVALQAYIENTPFGNSDWDMFSMCVTATKARIIHDFEDLLSLEQVQGFIPLEHQIATAKRVIQQLHGRAILADEVGLGKTIEAGLILKEYQLRGLANKILILVPASLVLQWTRELQEKFRIKATPQRNVWTWSEYDIVVASLDTAKREPHRSQILAQQWDMLIVDEAHKLKNSKTKNWQMVNQIPNKYMLLLTATPMQNELQELHTLITLLKPGGLGSAREFSSEHVSGKRVPKSADALKRSLSDMMIRNHRQDGGVNLPARNVEVVPIRFSHEEQILYESVHEFLKGEYQDRKARRASILPLLTLQREICSSPYAAMISLDKMRKKSKNQEMIQLIDGLMEKAGKVITYTKVERMLELINQIQDKCIVFTEYRATQDFLLYSLRKKGISAVPFRGGFKRGKKDWMKDLFAKKMQVLVATESGGEGINLQFCHHMINFDLPWNPMRLEQRIGRIHRLGQDKMCHVFNLATIGTIEEHIVRLLHEKIRLFEMVIGDLDHIITGKRFDKFEELILDMALTSENNEQLQNRLDAYGNEILTQMQESAEHAESGTATEL
jgi:SNF2 family DNA or RNA helicase